jgi:hypothetical protein
MRTDALAEAIREDMARNLKPFFAAATVGTTSSTAIDPVGEIAAICRENGLWLHVDGAYGGTFGVLPECRGFLDGVERADSFVVNPHKLMMVPLDCSLFYTRDPETVREAFALEAEYLKTEAHGAVDYMDYGLALGRRFRALKLWFTMRYFGREGFAAILRRSRDGSVAGRADFRMCAIRPGGARDYGPGVFSGARRRRRHQRADVPDQRYENAFRFPHGAERQVHHSGGRRQHADRVAGHGSTVGRDFDVVQVTAGLRAFTHAGARVRLNRAADQCANGDRAG